jgi:hypothetical protein
LSCAAVANAYGADQCQHERRRDDEKGHPQFVHMTVYKATERQIYGQNHRAAKSTAENSYVRAGNSGA